MAATKPPRVVNCPICAKPVPWVPDSLYRPFCSERCRKIDLGAWAAEAYRVADQGHATAAPDADESSSPTDA